MRRLLFLMAGLLPAFIANSQEACEFQYPETNGIWYTVLDEELKTVETRAGTANMVSGKIELTYGNTYAGNIELPSTVSDGTETYTVVKIGDFGFKGLTGISMPETLTEIGQGAFLNNIGLTTVTIPSSVNVIGISVFADCSELVSVSLPDGLTEIPTSLFTSCSKLTDVSIPAGVTTIGGNAFSRTAISSVSLPEGLTTIGSGAFMGCSRLTELTLPESVTQIGSDAFIGCSNLKSVECRNPVPPAISNNTFGSATYSGVLHVPNSALNQYKYNQLWNAFKTINPIPVEATSISLDKTVLTLYASGQSMVIHATVTPGDATGAVVWSSSDESIVAVDGTGRVHGVKTGKATVTATIGTVHADCEVTVKDIPATSVTVNHLAEPLYVGGTAQMTATVVPSNTGTPLVWSSSNDDIATVNAETGVVTGIAPGQAVITATAGGVYGTRAITVSPIEATSVTLSRSSLSMKVGDSETLIATVEPSNTTDATLIWRSNDDNIVTVVDGTVYAVGIGYDALGNPIAGHATVTVVCGNVTAVCPVTVELTAATDVRLDYSSIELTETQSQQLTATVLPETASSKRVEWSSSDATVAAVTSDGLVTAVKEGVATITATCGDVSNSCKVKVTKMPASGVVLSVSAITLQATQSRQITATVLPEGADQTVVWASNDDAVAVVDGDGLVTAVSVGTTEVVATAGNAKASCTVTVAETPAEQVVLSAEAATVNVGNKVSLTAEVLPETATSKTVEWSTDNELIATVVDGTVTGVAPGTATITATSGAAAAGCVITVLNPATKISLNYTELTMPEGWVQDLIATVEPENTTDEITWSSSDGSVVTVNEHGIVVALGEGSADVTATCGAVSAICKVTVLPQEQFSTVESIVKDEDGLYRVYNLNGVHVLTTSERSELNRLPKGIYVVNSAVTLLIGEK